MHVRLGLPRSRKSPAVLHILHRAEIALTTARISEIYGKSAIRKVNIADFSEDLFMTLPSRIYTEIHNFVIHAHKSEWDKCRTRQQAKFKRPLER